MFDLEKSKAHSIMSKMMLNQELYGSWDQPTETVVLRKEDPNTLQLLALKFADKVCVLRLSFGCFGFWVFVCVVCAKWRQDRRTTNDGG